MTTAEIDTALVGAWHAHLTFTEGPRQGEHERLRWTFLPDGLIVGTDAENGQLPPRSGNGLRKAIASPTGSMPCGTTPLGVRRPSSTATARGLSQPTGRRSQ